MDFETIRIYAFGAICLFAFCTIAVAATAIHSTVGLVYHLAGLALATSVLTLIGLPIFWFIGMHQHWGELGSLALLWIFWLSVGADAAAVGPRLFGMDSGNIPKACAFVSPELSAIDCVRLRFIAAFGFLVWIILNVYFCALAKNVIDPPPPLPPILLSEVIYPSPHQYSLAAFPSGPALGYPFGSSNYGTDTCLMCRRERKNGTYSFCGSQCRDEARSRSPLLLEALRGHDIFTMVEQKFRCFWKSTQVCPQILKVYRIVESSTSANIYNSYLRRYGNEQFRYHGTDRSCQIGDDGHTAICASLYCNACSIMRTSFQVSLSNPAGAFGQGVYTSSASNKASSHSKTGVMFLTKVVLGNVYPVERFAEVRSCPNGFQSVNFDRNNGHLNETVVYTDEAIRPVCR